MKKMMYYLSLMMFIVVVLLSCKDDDAEPAQQLLLSKIVRDEVTLMDFLYAEEKLISVNLYDNDGELALYTEYMYDDDVVVESRLYDEDNIMLSKMELTHNKAGQITKGDIYTSDSGFEDVERIVTFTYSPSGQLKSFGIAALGQAIYSLDEFTYDAAGHRVQLRRTAYPGDEDEYISYEIEYTKGDNLIPNHWNDYAFLLLTSDLDGYLFDMFNVSSHRTSWNSDGEVKVESRMDASKKQFNGDGYLISQTLKRTSLSGLSPQQLDEMTYEYIE